MKVKVGYWRKLSRSSRILRLWALQQKQVLQGTAALVMRVGWRGEKA